MRTRLALIGLAAGIPCALSAAISAPSLLVWNASASTPRGLYRVYPGVVPERGDWVVARLSPTLEALAAERHYLPRGVPLVKRVAASGGDRICASGAEISVNGLPVVVRKLNDAQGRSLPSWVGCRTLHRHELFLLGTSPWSFDGRYFGVTDPAYIVGRAELLWRA